MDPEDLARLGAALTKLRARRGLGVAELARRLDMTTTGYKHMERGKAAPSMAMLFAMSRVLECSWNELLGDPPTAGDESDWRAGYRAGVADAAAAARQLLEQEE